MIKHIPVKPVCIPAVTQSFVRNVYSLVMCFSPPGYEIPVDTWPGLMSVTQGEDGSALSMSWFVPPGTPKPENTDELVTLQSIPEATVYVWTFSGTPSIEKGHNNAKMLREALAKAGRTFDPHTYAGAGYESYFSLTHHNEIRIYA
ncbi:hypothetical protein PAMA_002017 [Pampus argenteus]